MEFIAGSGLNNPGNYANLITLLLLTVGVAYTPTFSNQFIIYGLTECSTCNSQTLLLNKTGGLPAHQEMQPILPIKRLTEMALQDGPASNKLILYIYMLISKAAIIYSSILIQ